MSQRCTICGNEFTTKRRKGLYCSQACTQKAYRRRKAEQRLIDADQRRKTAEEQHRQTWVRFLIDAGGLSRKQAERTFTALMSIGRVTGDPWEQMTLGLTAAPPPDLSEHALRHQPQASLRSVTS